MRRWHCYAGEFCIHLGKRLRHHGTLYCSPACRANFRTLCGETKPAQTRKSVFFRSWFAVHSVDAPHPHGY